MAKPSLLNPLRSHLNELPLIDSSSIRTKLREFRFSHFNVTLKHARNASVLPVIRAQSSPGSFSYELFWQNHSWGLDVISDFVLGVLDFEFSWSLLLVARRLCTRLQILQSGSDSEVQKPLNLLSFYTLLVLRSSLSHSCMFLFVLIIYSSACLLWSFFLFPNCIQPFSLWVSIISNYFLIFVLIMGRNRPWRVSQVSSVRTIDHCLLHF